MRSKIGLKSISIPESIVNKLKSDEDLETAYVQSTNVNEAIFWWNNKHDNY